jgi:Protein of unknown function (DUF1631)
MGLAPAPAVRHVALLEMALNDPRTQAALEAAMNQVKAAVTSAVDRASGALGVQAVSATRTAEREALSAAQFDLRRNIGIFHRVVGDALREKIDHQLAPREAGRRPLSATDWQSLSLVDDNEVEERMHADRIAQMIGHACEVELRDLAAYMGSLTQTGRADLDSNPLRAEALGAAIYRAIEAASAVPETRRVLARELGQAVAKAMPECYAQILTGLQARGVQPLALTGRTVEGPGNRLWGVNSGYASQNLRSSQSGGLDTRSGTDFDSDGSRFTRPAPHAAMPPSPGAAARRAAPLPSARHMARADVAASQADVQLMALLRRLTSLASRPGEFDATASHHTSRSSPVPVSGTGGYTGGGRISRVTQIDPGGGTTPPDPAYGDDGLAGMMAVNLIRAHREELVQASSGKLDHMVIDVVGSLFDQILSDSRVPPQMARQIARLQLPVLRVALNDSSFFSSRRHPVRRFVNRIASLACAFDDFNAGPGKVFLAHVSGMVQEIVDGDFDQVEVYTAKLASLETFIAEETHGEVEQTGTVGTLATKESELRLQQRYMLQLQAALVPLSMPAYLRDFLAQVWSQALVLANARGGPDSDRAARFRRVGRDLVMSVQPKGSPALRKKFLMQLPPLMKDLNEGMQLVGWPEPAQREFFGQLLPAHAESLKGQALSELDYNMMAKQLEAVFNTAVPRADTLSQNDPVPEVEAAVIAQRFTPEEAEQVGLVQESAVDWSGTVDIDLGAEADTQVDTQADAGAYAAADPNASSAPPPSLFGLGLDLDLSSSEPAEPTRGPQLIDHIKLGFAYQMHLKDEWQKVRLAHVSAGRSFFVFTRGSKHQETISMTSRMLARMCETGRLRAVESSYLMERATLRARKQLAALSAAPRL